MCVDSRTHACTQVPWDWSLGEGDLSLILCSLINLYFVYLVDFYFLAITS